MSSTDRNCYVVVGNPIAHSRSPQIHMAFAEQLGELIEYKKVEVELGGFAAFADRFKAADGAGMNVTVPFKLDAFNYVDSLDEHAQAAGAVNTVKFNADGSCQGFNTDGIGLLRDLTERHQITLKDKHVLMIGAGGAAQGALLPLLQAGIRRLTLMNRNLEKARKLLQDPMLSGVGTELSARPLNVLGEPAEIVINATSLGLGDDTMPLTPNLVAGAFCYDMSYGPTAKFCRWAESNGALSSVDGLGMLVEQAAQSYFIWRGLAPRTEPVYEMVRAAILGQVQTPAV